MSDDTLKRYRATFEGWKMPTGNDSIQAKDPVGPYTIEVYQPKKISNGDRRESWRARLLPTGQKFGGRSFKTSKEAQDTVAYNFRKQVSEWKEDL